MRPDDTPRLAPPGAGLPFPENLIARLLSRLHRATGSPASFVALFRKERELIRRLLDGRAPAELTRRVLIRRPRGLEDSSRNWSVVMTLDHLRIVHLAMTGVLESLAAETMPPGQASTAAVKPSPDVGLEILPDYEASCETLLATAGRIQNFRSRTRFPHPWFGPLDAHGWLALASRHLGIHRRQIERILAGIKSAE